MKALAAVVALIVAASLVHSPEVSAQAADGERIAFLASASDATGAHRWTKLLITDLDGNVTEIDDTAAAQGGPSWSPDGRFIAYMGYQLGYEVRIAASDGSSVRTLRRGCYGPAWSPDGAWIAISCDGAIAVIRPDGSDYRVVGDPPFGAGWSDDEAWSPSGTQLAVGMADSDCPEGYCNVDPYVLDVAAGDLRPLDNSLEGGPSWSPDGAELVSLGNAPGIHFIRADGTGRRSIPAREVVSDVTWSPDADRLAFREYDTGADPNYSITVVARDGSSRHSVAGDGHSVDWSPDSGHISFLSGTTDDDPRIEVVRADGSGRRAIVDRNDVGATALDRVSFSHHAFAPSSRYERIYGPDRQATGAAASRRAFASAGHVVIARSDDYADALAGASLAANLSAPLLVTTKERLSADVAAEVRRLGARTATLLGDATALSLQVEIDLRANGIVEIQRIAGPSRYDTAAQAAVSFDVGYPAILALGWGGPAGDGWADAVAASSLAAAFSGPILLTERGRLPEATRNELRRRGGAVIVGGPAAISPEVEAEVRSLGLRVERIGGADRYETSRLLTERAVGRGFFSPVRPWVATGRNWPDSLTAGPAAAHQGTVLVLVDGHDLARSPATTAWLREQALEHVSLVGGQSAISFAVEREFASMVGAGPR